MATVGRGLLALIACCWVLIFMCSPPLTGASRLSAAYKRALLEASAGNKPQVIRGELIHRDHPESSSRLTTGSVADRYTAAAARDQARNARRLGQGVEFSTPVSPGDQLYEQLEYAMTLYLGTPVQKFTLIVDTGSDLVWVQCKPCTSPFNCYKEADPFFDPSASSSYAPVRCKNKKTCDPTQFTGAGAVCVGHGNCHITYSYGTPGSEIQGVLSTETIAFGNTTEGGLGISKFVFGCMDNDTASFGTFDGLAGFSRRRNSLPSQLSKLTSSKVFSYCLVPFISATSSTSPLVFGASNSNGLRLAYTPLLTFDDVEFSTFYAVNMTGININGTAVSIPTAPLEFNTTARSGGTIFDSGTSFLGLIEDIYTPVVQALKDYITYPIIGELSSNTSLCYNFTGADQPDVPIMSLQFSGYKSTHTVDFPLSFENLFTNTETTTGELVWCLAFSNEGRLGFNVVGNIAQGDHYVETDLQKKRIGWTSTQPAYMGFPVSTFRI